MISVHCNECKVPIFGRCWNLWTQTKDGKPQFSLNYELVRVTADAHFCKPECALPSMIAAQPARPAAKSAVTGTLPVEETS